MKLVSFEIGGAASFGIWTDAGVVDLGRRWRGRFESLAAVLAAGGLSQAAPLASESPDHSHEAITLAKPLHDWGKCFCVGVNYPERNEEYKDGSGRPAYPSLFIRFPESFTGPDANLLRPRESEQLDYEGEVVIVIGTSGRRIAQADWRSHVCAYTIGNEGSIRDWIRHGKFNVTPGKNFPRSGSMGPFLVTADEVPDPAALEITTRVNGEVRQHDRTGRMMFSFGRIVEYISTFCTLEPGDIIFTGTPSGSGGRLDPPRYLARGDIVEVEVPGLGLLRNGIDDEH